MTLTIIPITFVEACEFIRQFHRHHSPPVGYKFCIGASDGENVVGVAVVGRPVARNLDDGWTMEVTRLCTDGTRNACSLLYGACRRAAFALGYKKIVTYTLPEEGGASLAASGYKCIGEAGGGHWDCPSRPRVDTHPLQVKWRWECEQ